MPTERLLVVDDDPAILDLCHRILQADGYTVIGAKRGEDALAKLEAQPFDLLLTDIRLPGMNGLELTRRVRDRGLGTSAATFQFFEYKGKQLGHLLDPRTGWPASGTASASVTAPTAAEADAS